MDHLDYLIKKLNRQSCSKQELEELKRLLDSEDTTNQYFEKCLKEEEDGIEPINRKISTQLWQQIHGGIRPEKSKKTFVSFAKRIAAVAAIVLLVIGISDWLSSGDKQGWTVVTNYSTKAKKIVLPDSSSVWLEQNSTLSYRSAFLKSERKTKLAGQAFFRVVRNPHKPFTVETEQVLTQVLGTSFNIRSKDTLVEVTVVTGRVRVTSGNNAVRLTPNQKISYNLNSGHFKKETTQAGLYTTWLYKHTLFDSISVKELAKLLKMKFKMPVIFKDEASKKAVFYSFRFDKDESLEELSKRVNYINEIKLNTADNRIEISKD